jgi:hypothetical protein
MALLARQTKLSSEDLFDMFLDGPVDVAGELEAVEAIEGTE